MENKLDGNAAAGILQAIFPFEMTLVQATCTGCGTTNPLGATAAYMHGMGTIGLCCKNAGGMVNSAVFKNSRGVPLMSQQSPFKWRHFEAEIILLCVRWYLRYASATATWKR